MKRLTFLAGIAAAGVVAVAARRPAKAGSHQYEVTFTDEEWRRRLGPDRYAILRENGTEPPYSSPLLREHRAGTYRCAGCDLDVFSSITKFDADEGWPSFYRPLRDAVLTREDHELLEARTEVHCRRCGGHLGHVFPDGPPPTGLRYCIDGLALRFAPAGA